jgi:hypothetical protein
MIVRRNDLNQIIILKGTYNSPYGALPHHTPKKTTYLPGYVKLTINTIVPNLYKLAISD